MFGHAKADDVVKERLDTLQKLVIPLSETDAFHWNGWPKSKQDNYG